MPLDVIQRLRQSHRPVVIAGALATRRSWHAKLTALQVPVFTTVPGKGAMDEALPHAAGVFTNSGGPDAPERQVLPKADLILGLGLRTTELIDIKPLPAPLLLVDEFMDGANGLGALMEAAVPPESIAEILQLLKSKVWGSDEVVATKAVLRTKLNLGCWLPAGVFRLIQRVLPETALFFLDTGNFCIIGEHVLTARRPRQIMGSALGRSMGVALPTGVGAALATRHTPVVVAVGDGGVRMYPDVITVAVREKLPILVLLMMDGSFASIRQGALKKGLRQDPLCLDSSYWASVFQALGCPAEQITSYIALEQALQAWDTSTGPLFLALVFDSNAYMAMTEGIR
jgi:thiamine pyrophosphate-dependent acetolactate synthase large subunit-like protein